MYTTDEWGRSVLHIQTGMEGMKLLQKNGLMNSLTPEEYKKHMESYNKIQEERYEVIMEEINKILKS